MAGRSTQEVVEVLALPSTTAARNTQEVIEVLALPSTVAGRVTQLVVEVLIYIEVNPAVADTFSGWMDGISTEASGETSLSDSLTLTDGYETTAGILQNSNDNLRNWLDSTIVTRYAFLTPLSVGVGDTFANLTGPPKSRFDFKDGLIVNFDNSTIHMGVDDLAAFFNDDIATALTVFFNSVTGTAFDTMMYDLLDSIQVNIVQPLRIGDTLGLSDSTSLFLTGRMSVADIMVMIDAAHVSRGGNPVADDTMNFTDSVTLGLSTLDTRAVFDTMTMADSVAVLTFGSLDEYLRRYLNDVI